MTKHDETGLQFGKGSAWTGTGDQREQTEDFAAIQVVQPKEKKKKRRQCGRGWEGHRNTYKQRCLLVSYTHTHSLPQSQQKPKTRTQMTECTPHTADPRVWSETLPGLKF